MMTILKNYCCSAKKAKSNKSYLSPNGINLNTLNQNTSLNNDVRTSDKTTGWSMRIAMALCVVMADRAMCPRAVDPLIYARQGNFRGTGATKPHSQAPRTEETHCPQLLNNQDNLNPKTPALQNKECLDQQLQAKREQNEIRHLRHLTLEEPAKCPLHECLMKMNKIYELLNSVLLNNHKLREECPTLEAAFAPIKEQQQEAIAIYGKAMQSARKSYTKKYESLEEEYQKLIRIEDYNKLLHNDKTKNKSEYDDKVEVTENEYAATVKRISDKYKSKADEILKHYDAIYKQLLDLKNDAGKRNPENITETTKRIEAVQSLYEKINTNPVAAEQPSSSSVPPPASAEPPERSPQRASKRKVQTGPCPTREVRPRKPTQSKLVNDSVNLAGGVLGSPHNTISSGQSSQKSIADSKSEPQSPVSASGVSMPWPLKPSAYNNNIMPKPLRTDAASEAYDNDDAKSEVSYISSERSEWHDFSDALVVPPVLTDEEEPAETTPLASEDSTDLPGTPSQSVRSPESLVFSDSDSEPLDPSLPISPNSVFGGDAPAHSIIRSPTGPSPKRIPESKANATPALSPARPQQQLKAADAPASREIASAVLHSVYKKISVLTPKSDAASEAVSGGEGKSAKEQASAPASQLLTDDEIQTTANKAIADAKARKLQQAKDAAAFKEYVRTEEARQEAEKQKALEAKFKQAQDEAAKKRRTEEREAQRKVRKPRAEQEKRADAAIQAVKEAVQEAGAASVPGGTGKMLLGSERRRSKEVPPTIPDVDTTKIKKDQPTVAPVEPETASPLEEAQSRAPVVATESATEQPALEDTIADDATPATAEAGAAPTPLAPTPAQPVELEEAAQRQVEAAEAARQAELEEAAQRQAELEEAQRQVEAAAPTAAVTEDAADVTPAPTAQPVVAPVPVDPVATLMTVIPAPVTDVASAPEPVTDVTPAEAGAAPTPLAPTPAQPVELETAEPAAQRRAPVAPAVRQEPAPEPAPVEPVMPIALPNLLNGPSPQKPIVPIAAQPTPNQPARPAPNLFSDRRQPKPVAPLAQTPQMLEDEEILPQAQVEVLSTPTTDEETFMDQFVSFLRRLLFGEDPINKKQPIPQKQPEQTEDDYDDDEEDPKPVSPNNPGGQN